MKNYVVSSVGLEAHDRLILQSMVSLLKTGHARNWRYGDSEHANIIFINADSDAGKKVGKSNLRGQLRIFISDNIDTYSAELFLKKPLRAQNIRDMLLQIASRNLNEPVAKKPEITVPHILDLLVPDKTKDLTQITSDGCPTILVNRHKKTLHLAGSLLSINEYKKVDNKQISKIHFGEDKMATLERNLTVFPAEKALWQFGVTLSDSQLLSQLRNFKTFALSRWPDFGKLQKINKAVPIASRLMKDPRSISDLMKTLNVTRTDVVVFLNASYLCGWLRPIATDPSYKPAMISASLAKPKKNPLFSMLRNKLGLGK